MKFIRHICFFLILVFTNCLLASNDKPFSIILLGAPGSGKGTQCEALSKVLGKPHIAVGDLLREEIKSGSILGEELRKFVDEGKLVPTNLTLNILFDRLDRIDCSQGFILDGSSRTKELVVRLCNHIEKKYDYLAILINITNEVALQRITGRIICGSCGAVYHEIYNPPLFFMLCNVCGGSLYQRKDDQEKIISDRLMSYRLNEKEVYQYYLDQEKIEDVEGNQSMEKVFLEIQQKIKKHFPNSF